jgi:hypothetical protein
MSIFEVLQSTGLPVAYSHFRTAQEPPFIVYMGDGQQTLSADNTFYWTDNDYQVEYYFTKKNETNEAAIEAALLNAGYQYEKSEDAYIQSEDLFVIYYTI